MLKADAAAAVAPVTLHYRVWQTDFSVAVASPQVADRLQRLCEQFEVGGSPGAEHFEIGGGPGSWLIRHGDEAPVVRKTASGAAGHVEWRMVGIASRAERQLMHWHAAALTRGDRTLLLPGQSGAGKSTLAVALAFRGFELLGEDVVFMDPTSRAVYPFRRAPRVRQGAADRLRSLGIEADPDLVGGDRLPVNAIPQWRSQPSAPLSHVLFVERDDEGPAELAPMTHAEAAIELQAHSHTLRRLRGDRWPLVRQALSETSCYRMIRGENLEDAVETVRRLVDASA